MPPPLAEDIPPRASVLAESLRAFGYDLGTAIADLVDNSISAGAKKVWVDFVWAGKASCIAITDDGRGMSEARLRDAMRLGSQHPGEKRAADDLGRFGLGLKTASFSQCRCVTVCTKEAGQKSVLRRWDLDHLAQGDQWQVLLEARPGASTQFERLPGSWLAYRDWRKDEHHKLARIRISLPNTSVSSSIWQSPW